MINSPKHIWVKCLVDGLPWKITTHVITRKEILRVNKYNVNHNHLA